MLAVLANTAVGMALIVTTANGVPSLSPSPPFQQLGNFRDPRSAVFADNKIVAEDDMIAGMSGRFDGEDDMLMHLAILGEERDCEFDTQFSPRGFTFSDIQQHDIEVEVEDF